MNFDLKQITLLIFTDIDGTLINNDTFFEGKNIEIACLHLLNKKEGYYLEKFESFYSIMVKLRKLESMRILF